MGEVMKVSELSGIKAAAPPHDCDFRDNADIKHPELAAGAPNGVTPNGANSLG